MKLLQFLLLYYWLKSKLFKRREVKPSASLGRKDGKPAGFITAKLQEAPKFSTMSEGEKTAFVMVGLIIGLGILQSLSKTSGPEGRNGLPPFVERLFSPLVKEEDLECVMGDLHEGYLEKLERLPAARAMLWLYSQVFRSVWPLARAAARDKLLSWLRQEIR